MHLNAKKEQYIYAMIFLCSWLFFIFFDSIFSSIPAKDTNLKDTQIQDYTQTHASSDKSNSGENQVSISSVPQIATQKVDEKEMENKTIGYLEKNLKLSQTNLAELNINDIKNEKETTRTLEDISILEKLYDKTSNKDVLKLLIEKLTQDYQFDKANEYFKELVNAGSYNTMDPHLSIYIMINDSSVNVMKPDSIKIIQPIIDEYRIRGIFSMDDYRFYNALTQLWLHNYEGVSVLFDQIVSPRYESIIKKFKEIKKQVESSKDMPAYYQDSLVALLMLKNGYFSIAKKISLDVMMKDANYILPYQVLAYSNFLTNNRDRSIEYFLKLVDSDKENKDLYKFLIGVSYYWLGKNEESVLYLSQLESAYITSGSPKTGPRAELITDIYRYLLLNYIQGEDATKMISTWQKILGQDDISRSDFYTYFYNVFYSPLVNGDEFTTYNKNPKLADDFVGYCYKVLPTAQHDICIYGHAGLDFLTNKGKDAQEKLLYLAKNYPQAYIYHSLGDYYYSIGEYAKAKNYYVKAISITDNPNEEIVIKHKLLEFVTGSGTNY